MKGVHDYSFFIAVLFIQYGYRRTRTLKLSIFNPKDKSILKENNIFSKYYKIRRWILLDQFLFSRFPHNHLLIFIFSLYHHQHANHKKENVITHHTLIIGYFVDEILSKDMIFNV